MPGVYSRPGGVPRDAAADEEYSRRLAWYLISGGITGLGRSVQKETSDARRTRFVVVFTILAASWLALLVL